VVGDVLGFCYMKAPRADSLSVVNLCIFYGTKFKCYDCIFSGNGGSTVKHSHMLAVQCLSFLDLTLLSFDRCSTGVLFSLVIQSPLAALVFCRLTSGGVQSRRSVHRCTAPPPELPLFCFTE
jgi:hypothetical protein